jgi:hypothetical protein
MIVIGALASIVGANIYINLYKYINCLLYRVYMYIMYTHALKDLFQDHKIQI